MVSVLSLSYGKDSLACLEACRILGYPIDRVIHAEVWATDTIPADLPPMVEFKKRADKIIKDRYGLEVEHIATSVKRERDCLTTNSSIPSDSIKSSTANVSTDSRWCEELGATLDSKRNHSTHCEKLTYEKFFYKVPNRRYKGRFAEGTVNGFPLLKRPWCNSKLKADVLDTFKTSFL